MSTKARAKFNMLASPSFPCMNGGELVPFSLSFLFLRGVSSWSRATIVPFGPPFHFFSLFAPHRSILPLPFEPSSTVYWHLLVSGFSSPYPTVHLVCLLVAELEWHLFVFQFFCCHEPSFSVLACWWWFFFVVCLSHGWNGESEAGLMTREAMEPAMSRRSRNEFYLRYSFFYSFFWKLSMVTSSPVIVFKILFITWRACLSRFSVPTIGHLHLLRPAKYG